uniref:Probable proline--tRNA ligase, mitochondrial n=1 Tax=Homalodisca liturata TaxID=320908 RepID=A0A1B6HIW0_9HEMI
MAKRLGFCHKVSRLFQPTNVVPAGAQVKNKDILSKSYKLMIDGGVIAHAQNGFFYLLPLATRALDKLTRLVDEHMMSIGAQKISCPTLTSSDIWQKTGRLSMAGSELFHLKDRHNKDFILSPTHEESITQMLASQPALSYKQLPLLLYQTTAKFRDEMKPRFGLLRTREFLMKDLYSFDTSAEAAQATYELVSKAYHGIFNEIGVNYFKVRGLSGVMGGEVSHEFHFPADIGDDTVRSCGDCGHGWNKETNENGPCEHCGSNNISESKGIEVGHMFILDTRYSAPLQATYTGADGGRQPLVMGSYGLGLTRILAAGLEVLSLPDQLRWPPALAPYTLIIITPKEGSKESHSTEHLSEELYWSLHEVRGLEGEVIIDDRSHLTIGRRLQEARRTGYPLAAVVGKAAVGPVPAIELQNLITGQTTLHSLSDFVGVVADCSKVVAVQ